MKKAKISGYVDSDTGEIFDDHVAVLVPKRKTAFTGLYGDRFMIVAQHALLNIASDREITGEVSRVFMYLFSKLDFDNYIQVPQIEIAESLGMHKQHVSRAIKTLERKEILLEGPKQGRSKFWRLNPEYGYKGSPEGKVSRDPHTGHLRLVSSNDKPE